MRKIRKFFVTALMLIGAFSMTISPVMADSASSLESDPAIMTLKIEVPQPDFSKGILIKESWGKEQDGTPYLERIYIKNDYSNGYELLKGNNKVTYTGTRWYGATGTAEVTATFRFYISEQKVYVESASGRLVDGAGYSEFVDLGISTSGEGTKKAKATYSCKINRHLGGWVTYSASVGCKYDGKRAWL